MLSNLAYKETANLLVQYLPPGGVRSRGGRGMLGAHREETGRLLERATKDGGRTVGECWGELILSYPLPTSPTIICYHLLSYTIMALESAFLWNMFVEII